MKIIGLKGPKYVGKSTYAQQRVKHLKKEGKNAVSLSLATPIKEVIKNWTDDQGELEVIESKLGDNGDYKKLKNEYINNLYDLKTKENYRYYYQSLGDILRGFSPDIFIDELNYKISNSQYDVVFIDDVRYFNEAKKLNLDELIILDRASVTYSNEHSSEMIFTAEEEDVLSEQMEVIHGHLIEY